MILTLKNRRLPIINDLVGSRIPGESREFYSADRVLDESDALRYPVELLNAVETHGSMPDHKLELK